MVKLLRYQVKVRLALSYIHGGGRLDGAADVSEEDDSAWATLGGRGGTSGLDQRARRWRSYLRGKFGFGGWVKQSRFSSKGKSTDTIYNVVDHESNPSHYQLSADIIVIHHRITSYKALHH
jgi:hypothetical protein